MPFKTFISAPLSSSDMNTYLMQQAVITCTSSTRPGSPTTGMCIFETDTLRFKFWNGTIWDWFPGQTVATSSNAATSVTAPSGTETVGAGTGLTLSGLVLSSSRTYFIEISGRSSAAGSCAAITAVRASTGTVTTSSTQIAVGQWAIAGSAGANFFDTSLRTAWTPASSGTWNLAVTQRTGSAVNSTWGNGNGAAIISLIAG